MITVQTVYEGNLRTNSIHIKSGNNLLTDAPIDNEGKGETFSPTDLLCTSLSSCMLTIMGISSNKHGIDFKEVKLDVTKFMTSNPRRISKIELKFSFLKNSYSDKEKKILELAALNCPVAKSIHPDIELNVHFNWSEEP